MIGIVIGTRPEWIKCEPLLKYTDLFTPIFVNQHSDLLSEKIRESDITISIKEFNKDRLNNIISSILSSTVFEDRPWKAIMVQGDTAVAYGAALAAFHKQIQVIHLEAGLRTYDTLNPWPEEGYRHMIDSIATIALCPSNDSAENLRKENFKGIIEIVGNTGIDAVAKYKLTPKIGNKVLITLHRRENWSTIHDFFTAIETLANIYTEFEFIIAVHPNPAIKTKAEAIFHTTKIVQPLPHDEICKIVSECNCIISDSGGIQEEASFFGKKVFCCRKVTERTELMTDYLIMTPTPEKLLSLFTPQTSLLPMSNIYGNGYSNEKVYTCLKAIYRDNLT